MIFKIMTLQKMKNKKIKTLSTINKIKKKYLI